MQEYEELDKLIENLKLREHNSSGITRISIGEDDRLVYHGIKDEDRNLWKELFFLSDTESIKNIIDEDKVYLLTTIIGIPNDDLLQLWNIRNAVTRYGNIFIHLAIANSHDSSIVKPRLEKMKENPNTLETFQQTFEGMNFLLNYYEDLRNYTDNEISDLDPDNQERKKRSLEILFKTLSAQDIYAKTPLLLA